MTHRCHYCGRFTESYFGTSEQGDYCCDRCELRIIREEGGIDAGVGRIMDELAPDRDRDAGHTVAVISLSPEPRERRWAR